MTTTTKLFTVILIGFLLLLPMSSSVLLSEETFTNNLEESDSNSSLLDGESGTRASPSTRENFQIMSTTPVSMPEENASWIQDDWSGGPGQNLWTDASKYNSSENINDATSPGTLILGEGDGVEAWKQLPDGFGRRYRHRMVWNPTRSVFYTFGGVAGSNNVVNEFYEYNPANGVWTRKSNGPSARCSSMVVYDTVSDLLWVYGGRDRADPGGTEFNDMWSYDPSTNLWTQKSDGPGGRSEHAGVFNPLTREIIVYGGYTSSSANQYPSDQVFVYETQNDNWVMKKRYTMRYYHSAVWNPITNTMFCAAGALRWSGGGFTYINELNEYFPTTDTWVNRTPVGDRVRAIMVWDTLNNKLLLHGGGEANLVDVWAYDHNTDVWTRKLDSPASARDKSTGAWDSVRNELVTFGGTIGNSRTDEVYVYSPNATSYEPSGELTSSVFDAGRKVNPKTVSFNLTKPLPPGLGTQPVKIQIAGSEASAEDADSFIGPNGFTSSDFNQETGQATPSKLDGSRYLAYNVELSTGNELYTPELNWVKIDYYTYPGTYAFISTINITNTNELPLRFVNWTSTEPGGTSIEISFRQSYSDDLSSKAWEKVSKGQKTFTYKGGMFFQYKVDMTTTDGSITPILDSITFTFNQKPGKPEIVTPVNNSWVGDSRPELSWLFTDPDAGDHQSAFDIQIATEDTFTLLKYTDTVDQVNTTFKIAESLDDGTYFYMIRTSDNYGSIGPWSDMYTLKIDTKKPDAPLIDCSSHPLESVWYSTDRIVLDWNEPKDIGGIDGFGYVLDRFAETIPPENLSMTIDEYNLKHTGGNTSALVYDNVDDGIWYFHLRAEDSLGIWSDTSTIMIRIDTEPPLITDLTPTNATAGDELKFKFVMNDTGSGIDIASITWKYPSEIDYRFDELLFDDMMNWFVLLHVVEFTSDAYIEYYVSVNDLAEPSNEIRYPSSGINKIDIVDNIPPEIVEIPGDINHNRYNNLEITVKVTDNVGVSDVQIFLNDQSTGLTMKDAGLGKFSISIDRVELLEHAGYGGDDIILYKVKAWDFQNNVDTAPTSENFRITLLDIEDDDGGKDDKSTEDKGLSRQFLINIILMIVIIVVVALVLFMFIKKQSKKMDEDRHKLRMAIADVSEAAASSSPSLAAPPAGTQPSAGLQGQGQAPSIDVPFTPAGYLPPASTGPPSQADLAQQQADIQAMDQVGQMAPAESTPEPGVMQSEPAPGETVRSDVTKDKKVKIGDDLSISLPGESK
jgi:N-acetylneuraminic acid mutarotase